MMRSSLILIMLCGLLAGCQTGPKLDGVKELIEHRQFQRAAHSAPEWTREALRKVASLEYELERKK